jgi:hypothetical protein
VIYALSLIFLALLSWILYISPPDDGYGGWKWRGRK